MLFKFFSRPAPVVLRNYPNFHLAKLFAQSVRDNDLSAVSRICEKYPSIINHCSRERDELFPLSVALVNHSRGISSDPIIEFLLGKSASTRLQRTREVAWIGGGGGSPASFGIDRVQEKIENYNGPLKKELEERFKLESSVLAISEAVR
ncbi:MAG: hypothetical protein NTU49_07305, partial [Gammaproteobacteria bacterium]|nr:hypothetical protein [Gammaproteobacteria bacterium]